MKILELKKDEAEREFKKYIATQEDYFDKLDKDYLEMKLDLSDLYDESLVIKKNGKIDDYQTDLNFACAIYEYFNSKDWFNIGLASNYGFWRYICTKVAADIIHDRHGETPEYYYKKDLRMYIPTLWWFIYMGFEVDLKTTKNKLSCLTTDYILQIVERPGRDGIYIDVYRGIINTLTSLPKEVRDKKINKNNLLRRVMIQNTAMIDNYNLVFDGVADIYVKKIFSECGVEI